MDRSYLHLHATMQFYPLFMVNIVDHIIDKDTNTKSIKDNTMDMQSIFQPTIYNIGGLGSRLQD